MIGLADGDDDWSNFMIMWYDAVWALLTESWNSINNSFNYT